MISPLLKIVNPWFLAQTEILNWSGLRNSAQSRYATAFIGGLFLSASFPKPGLMPLAWLGPGLILFSSLGQSARTTLKIGYYAGLSQYLFSLYWLLLLPVPVHAVAAWLGVCCFLALYTAGWSWICWKLFPVQLSANPALTDRQLLERFYAVDWRKRAFWAAACAIAWVAMEMAICRIMTGFPYSLGVSQFKNLALIQIASVTGVYGVSFLVVWSSIVLISASLKIALKPGTLRESLYELALPVVAVIVVCAAGFAKLGQHESTSRELRIALVQPSIPQFVIWDESEKTNRFRKLVELSRQSLTSKPDLLVWPESALPTLLNRFNRMTYDAITNLVSIHKTWMILGANDVRLKKNPRHPGEVEYLNSSFLIDPAGQLVAKYHKRHLVMFGEYMPLGRWFPFLNYFRTLDSGFAPGDSPVPFQLTNLNVKVSVLICSEDVFPHLARDYVEPDTDFLLNLTNNGWFGESAAQWQHAANAVFRAIENRLPLVRCTNNGLTCWVDPLGGLHDVYFPGSTDIYKAGVKLAKVPLRAPGQNLSLAIYTRLGDWFGWSCVGITVAMLARQLICQHRRKSHV